MLRIFACFFLLLAGPPGAVAQWAKNHRTIFMNECLEACRKNPNVHPTRRSECRAYCGCALEKHQKNLPDYQAAEDAVNNNPNSAEARVFKEANTACSKRVFGG
jgi:hypothetical protein